MCLGRIMKGHGETLEANGFIHYIDYGDSFMDGYLCQHLSNCVLYVHAV